MSAHWGLESENVEVGDEIANIEIFFNTILIEYKKKKTTLTRKLRIL